MGQNKDPPTAQRLNLKLLPSVQLTKYNLQLTCLKMSADVEAVVGKFKDQL